MRQGWQSKWMADSMPERTNPIRTKRERWSSRSGEYGSFDSGTGGIFCSANPNDNPTGATLGFVPTASGSSYREGLSSTVWGEVSFRTD